MQKDRYRDLDHSIATVVDIYIDGNEAGERRTGKRTTHIHKRTTYIHTYIHTYISAYTCTHTYTQTRLVTMCSLGYKPIDVCT